MASESLFSVKRMLKEIKEKLSVSSGSSGSEENLGDVVAELKSTVTSLQTTVSSLSTNLTTIKNTNYIQRVRTGYWEFTATGQKAKLGSINGYIRLWIPDTGITVYKEIDGKLKRYIAKSGTSALLNMLKAYAIASFSNGMVVEIPMKSNEYLWIESTTTSSYYVYFAILSLSTDCGVVSTSGITNQSISEIQESVS